MKHIESEHQQALFQWATLAAGGIPELKLMYHVPNGGKRDHAEAACLNAEGVKPGVPDIVLPVARGRYHGLYIELKAAGGKPTENQIEWLNSLSGQGYHAVICYGWTAARTVIEEYLRLPAAKAGMGG